MIEAVHGALEARGLGWAVVRVGGLSLRVNVPSSTIERLGAIGSEVHLHAYLHLREDAVTLYGFSTPEEQGLFQSLIAVSGVGPRLALGVLSAFSPEHVALAVAAGNPDALAGAPGIGKKTASRIILELKGKLEKEWLADKPSLAPGNADVLAALSALGYSAAEAMHAVSHIDPATKGLDLPLEERVRQALAYLGSET